MIMKKTSKVSNSLSNIQYYILEIEWVFRSGSAYKFVTDQALTWTEARDFCDTIGGHLLRMETVEEYEMIKSIVQANYGQFMWSVHVVSSCGQFMWSVHMVSSCGQFMWSVHVFS